MSVTLLRGDKSKEEIVEKPDEVPTLKSLSKHLKKRIGIQTVRGYSPPSDVEFRINAIARDVFNIQENESDFTFENKRTKLKFLTRVMSELDHFIPNSDLTYINSVGDAAAFFCTPQYDMTSYENLSKQDLPQNLHIQLEPLRFDPETDTMFGGVSAFPEQETVVTSLKYRRKYGKSH